MAGIAVAGTIMTHILSAGSDIKRDGVKGDSDTNVRENPKYLERIEGQITPYLESLPGEGGGKDYFSDERMKARDSAYNSGWLLGSVCFVIAVASAFL